MVDIDQFSMEWLRNTPFSDYTIPALVLAMVVGGSSLIATTTVFTGREAGVLPSVAAGLIMVGYIVVEVLSLPSAARSWFEGVYLGLDLVMPLPLHNAINIDQGFMANQPPPITSHSG